MNRQKLKKITQKLRQSSIGIAGIGGLGSNAAIALARVGIGRLVLVDYDSVEKNNISRQYYFLDQVKKFKVEAMKENIGRINHQVILETHIIKLEKGSMEKPFRDVDVIIEALDNAKTKAEFIEEILLKLPDKPIIGASGVAGYGHSDRIVTHRCGKLYLCYDESAPSSEDDVRIAPRVALMGNWEANLAVEIILGEDYEY